MTLTTRERERIRMLEEYRHDIQMSIKNRDSKESRSWKFLNSAFGLWLCSAIFLSGGTALFTKCQNEKEVEIKRRAAIEALELEIGYRISNALARLADAQMEYDDAVRYKTKPADEIVKDQTLQVTAAIRQLFYAPQGSFPPLYPEHAKHGLPVLITELRRNETDTKSREALATVLRSIMSDATGEVIELPPRNWIQKIRGAYILPRWESDFDLSDPLQDR